MTDFRALFRPSPQIGARPLDLSLDVMEAAAALAGEDHFVFLDSADTLGPLGSFSVLAWTPKLIFRCKDRTAGIRRDGCWSEARGNPFEMLSELFGACVIKGESPRSLPFYGGAIGYFAYDLFRFLEHYDTLAAADDFDLPDAYLPFYDSALIHLDKDDSWHLACTNAFDSPEDLTTILAKKSDDLFDLLAAENKKEKPATHDTTAMAQKDFVSNFTKEEYLKAVGKALDHIYAGDIYQVNLSQRFRTTIESAPFDLFRTLRAINPSRYGAFLDFDGHAVVSSSPELFLTTAGRSVETRPIKGTRPRGRTLAEDDQMRRDLQTSAKDKAELSMIVDLERNDLGRVCVYGSVRVHEHAYVDPLPTVFHTVSTVRGVLREGVGPVELLRATFPGGSITGCPKIRSIEIIDDLEPTRRHVYTGGIGFIDFCGNLTLNIAIRTLVCKSRDVYFQVGGGIVADSDPEAEFEETLDKARALMQAVRTVDGRHE